MNLDDLSEEDLAKLAEDGTDEEKRAVARHPNTSLQTLLYLTNTGFFEDVDRNPMMLLHTEVGSNEVVWILEKVADKTDRGERLEELASSIWEDVRRNVAYNKNTPPATLSLLAKDEDWFVRRAVARNESTPQDTLDILAQAKDDIIVRNIAKEALAKLKNASR